MLLLKNIERRTLKFSLIYILTLCLGLFGLLASSGCSADLSGVLTDVLGSLANSTDATLTDLVGTWTGTLTENNQTQNYLFNIDSAGNFTAGDGTPGTASVSTGGTVIFTYAANGYTVKLQGLINSDKSKITMSTSSWTGTATGSTSFTGTLTKSTSGNFTSTDLVGTWTGSLTENGQTQSYQFTVDTSGNFATAGGTSGSATISSAGTVVFTYSSGGYSGTFQGTMSSNKTQIIMATHTWTGTASGSAAFTGTLSKSTSTSSGFAAADLVGTWTGTLTTNGQPQNYQFAVDSAGKFTAGDGTTTGTAVISATGTVGFTYLSNGYTVTLQGAMSTDKTQILMATSTWTGTSSGSGAFTGTLSKS